MKHSHLLHIALLVVAALALVASTGCVVYPTSQPTMQPIVGGMQPSVPLDQGRPGPVQAPDPVKPGMEMVPAPFKPGPGQPPDSFRMGPGQSPEPMRPAPGQVPEFKPGMEFRPDPVNPNMGQVPDPRIGGDPQHKEPIGEASVTFTANRTNIKAGECATLTWNIQGEGAFWVELDAQRVERSGQKQVCPQATQAYNLHVDLGERVDRREVVINVESSAQQSAGQGSQQQNSQGTQTSGNSSNSQNSNNTSNSGNSQSGCQGAPTFSTFSANKSAITLGESVTLSWGGITNGNSTILVKSVMLSGVGEVGSPGSRSVTPSAAGTATYTLTATGCGGTATKSVSISVAAKSGGFPGVTVRVIQFDLQLADIYTNGAGQVLAKIKNNGPDTAQTGGTLMCSGAVINQNGSFGASTQKSVGFNANLKSGETMEIFTGITRTTQMLATCKINVNLTIGDKANNEFTKKLQ